MNYRTLLLSLFTLASAGPALAEDNGQILFETHCSACHAMSGKPTVAPPVFAVVNHVKDAYPEKDQFIETIVNWVANPQEDTALMRGAIRKFGLMPPLNIDPIKVKLIAQYLYDGNIELPEWYIEHYKAEHGHEPKQQ